MLPKSPQAKKLIQTVENVDEIEKKPTSSKNARGPLLSPKNYELEIP
jgi:hypothetical protein